MESKYKCIKCESTSNLLRPANNDPDKIICKECYDKREGKEEEFIASIKRYIKYWEHQDDRSLKEKLEGLAFSILVVLDGMSGDCNISRDDLDRDVMLHDLFYEEANGKQ